MPRDALEMSVSPLQNFWKPPPVPDVATVTVTFGYCPWKLSAASVASGATVLDPSMTIAPLSDVSPPAAVEASPPREPPQAANSAPAAPMAMIAMRDLRFST